MKTISIIESFHKPCNNKYWLTFFMSGIFIVLNSCNQYRLKNNIEKLYKQEIALPNNMMSFEGERIQILDFSEKKPRIVIWYDSTECGLCKLHTLPIYQDIEEYCRTLTCTIDIVFLFSPTRETVSQLCEEAPSNTKLHDYPIYIDTANMFAKLNPCIPENKLMHSFLLDATNHVVLVGSPIQNQAMFDLYKKTIDEMLN